MPNSIKQDLINLYSQNLFLHTGSEGLFVCPLCLRIFNSSNLNDLSIEHIIPKALGGKILTITCVECNNKIGSKYFSHLKRNFEYIDIIQGKSNAGLDSLFSIDGKKISAKFYMDGDKYTFIGQPKRSNPKNIDYINSQFIKKNVDKIDTTFKLNYSSQKVKLSKLIIAYLMLFRQFGYYFLFNHTAKLIYSIITEENISSKVFNFFSMDSVPIDNGRPLVGLLTKPEALFGYALLQIPIKTKNSTKLIGSFLPYSPYIKFDSSIYPSEGEKLSITFRYLEKPLYMLKDENIKLPYKVRINLFD